MVPALVLLVGLNSILAPRSHYAGKQLRTDMMLGSRRDVVKSMVMKRSIVIRGRKTSVSLEEPFWSALKDIARQRDTTLSDLVGNINVRRQHGNLSSALRLFVLGFYQDELRRESRAETTANIAA